MAFPIEIVNQPIRMLMESDGWQIVLAIATVALVGITAFFLWRQIQIQTKGNSARLTIDYVNRVLTENKDVIDILNARIKNKKAKFDSDKSVRVLLNGFENIIQFSNDGIITKTHVLNTLRITLTKIKNDSEVQRIIKETQEKTPTAFDLLDKFIEKNID